MKLDFEKWHGCRNDFVVVWIDDRQADMMIPSLVRRAAELCSRGGAGIGADGILALHRPPHRHEVPRKLTIVNADGSLARNCGNGLRCAALSVLTNFEEQLRSGGETLDGVEFLVQSEHGEDAYPCRFVEGRGSKLPFVAVTMPVPAVGDAVDWHGKARHAVEGLRGLTLGGGGLSGQDLARDWNVVQIGNPHIIFFVEGSPGICSQIIQTLGPALQQQPFADGINVEVAREIPSGEVGSSLRGGGDMTAFEVAVWERGVGITLACGSGACAVAVAALKTGLYQRDDQITIRMPGGDLKVAQAAIQDHAILTGPAVPVFRGTLDL